MISGIRDLDYGDARRIVDVIIERTIEEEVLLQKEMEEKKIEILLHEYAKRLDAGKHIKHETDHAIHACNRRMEEIEEEIFSISNKRGYFEVQRDKLSRVISLEV
ncbi:MAG: hypothetical protein PHO15_05430 [Eubacteriales bacterium]|nr:hypothetical protein [Eubacteriales bacterium]